MNWETVGFYMILSNCTDSCERICGMICVYDCPVQTVPCVVQPAVSYDQPKAYYQPAPTAATAYTVAEAQYQTGKRLSVQCLRSIWLAQLPGG